MHMVSNKRMNCLTCFPRPWLLLLALAFSTLGPMGETLAQTTCPSPNAVPVTIPLNSARTLLSIGVTQHDSDIFSSTIFAPFINASWASIAQVTQATFSTYGGIGGSSITLSIAVSGISVGCYEVPYGTMYTESPCGLGQVNPCTNSISGTVALQVVSGTTAFLVDPVPELVSGGVVLNSLQLQAHLTGGSTISGVAADGVTQAVIRIQTISAGHKFTLTLLNDKNVRSSSATNNGALGIQH